MKKPVGMSKEKLKEIRQSQQWTQATMASWLGVARNTVARMESGEIKIPVTTARLALLVIDEKNQQKILSCHLT